MRRYLFPGVCVIALVLALHTLTLASGIPASLRVEPLEIHTADGARHTFTVHVADTPETRARGLMFVTRLDADRGMLFDFERPQPISMWMKNTPLSLDMLFIDTAGRISQVEARTRPFSTESIHSREDVLAVLELNGGTAARLGIAVGDRVRHPLFEPEHQ